MMSAQNTTGLSPLDEFSSLAYLADASITCSELETQKEKNEANIIKENNEAKAVESETTPTVLADSEDKISEEKVTSSLDNDSSSLKDTPAAESMQVDITPMKKENAMVDTTVANTEVISAVEAAKNRVEVAVGGCKECLSLSLKDLAQHIISKHKGPNGFTCDFCHTLFTSSVSFGKHILGHVINVGGTEHSQESEDDPGEDRKKAEKEGDGTYHCNTCDKRFSSFLDLQRHLSLHKNYVCAVCDKGFSRPVVFKKHMQVHSREEVRKCEAERDQLYEEIKAAAAETKVPEKAAGDGDGLSKVSPLAEKEPSDLKKKKRKNTQQKAEDEAKQANGDGGTTGTKKTAAKRGADKRSGDASSCSKKKRAKTGKGDKDSNTGEEVKASTCDEGKAQMDKGNRDDIGASDVKDAEGQRETGGEGKPVEIGKTVGDGKVVHNEETTADGKGSADLKTESDNKDDTCNVKEADEANCAVVSKAVPIDVAHDNVNVLMDAVEATAHADPDAVILITSAMAAEGDALAAAVKDEVKADENFKIIVEQKEREKSRRPSVKRSTSYKCTQCTAEFKSRLEARDHERHTHNAVLPWQCEVCGEGFWSSSQFKKHSSVEHNDNVPFKCEHCGKKLSGPGILRTHLGIHTGIRPYACHLCSRDFLTRTNLQDHLIKHANPRGYCCHLCPSKFNLRTDLSSHIRTVHENIRPWKCEQCDYAFPRQSALLRHMRTHTGEKPHKCEFCGKTFARVENCMEHRRIHTGERPHVCEVCGKTFKDSGNFSNHRKIHKDGYVPRRKKKMNGKGGDENEKQSGNESPGKVNRPKPVKSEVSDESKTYGVIGPDGKVVGAAFESLGSAVAALGTDGRVAFESLGSAVAALIGNSLPSTSAQAAPTAESGNAAVNSAEVEAAINGALVGGSEAQGQTVTVGTENIALASYPAGVVQGSAIPTATLHDIVNAATMSATMVSNLPAQNETEVQEAMTHSNTFLQIGNILFSLDVDNGLKTLNQVGNMGEFLTLSLAGAQVEADGQTVISQPHHTAAMAEQSDVQHVQIGVLPDASKPVEEGEIQIQAIVENPSRESHTEVRATQNPIPQEEQTLLTCVVDDQSIVHNMQGADTTPEADQSDVALKQEVEDPSSVEHTNETALPVTNEKEAADEMHTILPRPES